MQVSPQLVLSAPNEQRLYLLPVGGVYALRAIFQVLDWQGWAGATVEEIDTLKSIMAHTADGLGQGRRLMETARIRYSVTTWICPIATVPAVIPFDTLFGDNLGTFASSQLTVNQTGIYLINLNIAIANTQPDGQNIGGYITIDGTRMAACVSPKIAGLYATGSCNWVGLIQSGQIVRFDYASLTASRFTMANLTQAFITRLE